MRVKASRLPLGDQAGEKSATAFVVSCLTRVPSAFMVKISESPSGFAGVIRLLTKAIRPFLPGNAASVGSTLVPNWPAAKTMAAASASTVKRPDSRRNPLRFICILLSVFRRSERGLVTGLPWSARAVTAALPRWQGCQTGLMVTATPFVRSV